MIKISRALLAACVCLTLTVVLFGCKRKEVVRPSDNNTGNGACFAAETDQGVLTAEKKTLVIGFKNGEPASVSPTTNGPVKAEVKDKEVHFSLVGVQPKHDATLAFMVEGTGKNEKVSINITLPGTLVYEDLDPKIAMISYKIDNDGPRSETFIFTRGVVESVAVIPPKEVAAQTGRSAKLTKKGGSEPKSLPNEPRPSGKLVAAGEGRQISITTTGVLEPGRYEITVTSKGGKAGAKIYVDAEVPLLPGLAAQTPADGKGNLIQVISQPITTITFEKSKLEGKIPSKGMGLLRFGVKVTAGKAERAECLGKGLAVALSADKGAVLVTVNAEAEPGSYDIWIIGKDDKGADAKVVLNVLLQ
jgi:hypothetical protein